MDYYRVEKSLQVLFEQHIRLSQAQIKRIRQACMGVLLAGSSQLTWIARWLKGAAKQDSRVQWLRRLLTTPYLQHEYVYEPLIKQAIRAHNNQRIHLIMDRTALNSGGTDLLSVNMYFRKRAVPLVWQCMDHGMSGLERQSGLIDRVQRILPTSNEVIFHGDNEFGGIDLMKYVRRLGWDFMLGQSESHCYRQSPGQDWTTLKTLPVKRTRPVYLTDIELTKTHAYGGLNLLAFYKPRFKDNRKQREITYCATTLPVTPALKPTGRRRWGIEPSFKDLKSSGWNLQLGQIQQQKRLEGLVTLLHTAYLWATCVGRWLCKSGRRAEVDAKAHRHLSLFRLGWDWLVQKYRRGHTCPVLLRLYQ